MHKFKKSFICDACGGIINDSHFRIEWGHSSQPAPKDSSKFDFIQVCHNQCSYGIRTDPPYPCTFGDIIFDQLPPSADQTNQRLDDLAKSNQNLSSDIKRIKNNIFE